MSNALQPRTGSPSGSTIAGWSVVLVSGVLAIVSAILATTVESRILFSICAAVLIVGDVLLVARWYRKN